MARQRSNAANAKIANAYHANNGMFARKNCGSGCAYSQSTAPQAVKHSSATSTEQRTDGAAVAPIRPHSRSMFTQEDRCISVDDSSRLQDDVAMPAARNSGT